MAKFCGRAWGYLVAPIQRVEATSLEEAENIATVKPVLPDPWPEFFHDEWEWYFRHPDSQREIEDGVFEIGSYTLVEIEATGPDGTGFDTPEQAADAIDALVVDENSRKLPQAWVHAGFEIPGWEDTEILEM